MSSAPQCHAAIQQARLDIQGGLYSSAAHLLTGSLIGRTTGPQNSVERERMTLLRAEAYHQQGDYAKALADAVAAAEESRHTSPQAQFMTGCELFALFRIEEAVAAFDIAEALMKMPAPEALVDGDEAERIRRLWAEQGVAPSEAAATPPEDTGSDIRVVTYEWQADLARWRLLAQDAAAVLSAMVTRVCPRVVLHRTIDAVQRRLVERSGRTIVLTIRNDTSETLTFDSHQFKDGAFLEGLTFPTTIPPLSIGIAGVYAVTMLGGVTGTVVYAVGDHAALFHFHNPLLGNFSSTVSLAPLARVRAKALTAGKNRTAGATVCGTPMRASAALSGIVQSFALAQVNATALTDLDIVSIIDYLAPPTLRKATAVSKRWRRLANQVPPMRFYGLRASYPDYRCTDDYAANSWTVRDTATVGWRIFCEPTCYEASDVFFVDAHDQKIFVVNADLYSRSTSCTMYYGSRKCPTLTYEDTWLPGARKAQVLLGKRTFGVLQLEGTTLKLVTDCGVPNTKVTAMRLRKDDPNRFVLSDREGTPAATVQVFSRAPNRNVTAADIVMQPGADAMLVCFMTFFAMFRLS
jgi:hypothetical protein